MSALIPYNALLNPLSDFTPLFDRSMLFLQVASYDRTLNFHREQFVCSLCGQKLHFAARSVCTSLICTPQVSCPPAADPTCKRCVRRTALQEIFIFFGCQCK